MLLRKFEILLHTMETTYVDFEAKLGSLKPGRCYVLDSLDSLRKTENLILFLVIMSAHDGTTTEGLYHSDNDESLDIVEKKIHSFKEGTVIDAVNTLNTLIKLEKKL